MRFERTVFDPETGILQSGINYIIKHHQLFKSFNSCPDYPGISKSLKLRSHSVQLNSPKPVQVRFSIIPRTFILSSSVSPRKARVRWIFWGFTQFIFSLARTAFNELRVFRSVGPGSIFMAIKILFKIKGIE